MSSYKSLIVLFITVLTGLGCWVNVARAETVFVQAQTAHLRSGKTSLSQTVATVTFGDSLELVRREGDWLEVRTSSGLKGWIFANKITTTKPADHGDRPAGPGKGVRQTEASRATASVGARGLDTVSQDYAKRTGISQRHREAVDRLTNYRVTEQEVEEFLRTGRLGEYAK